LNGLEKIISGSESDALKLGISFAFVGPVLRSLPIAFDMKGFVKLLRIITFFFDFKESVDDENSIGAMTKAKTTSDTERHASKSRVSQLLKSQLENNLMLKPVLRRL
jgi:hypothetical protein